MNFKIDLTQNYNPLIITIFTTAPSAKPNIDGKMVSTQRTDAYATVIWKDIELKPGKNLIEIRTPHGNDSAEWVLE